MVGSGLWDSDQALMWQKRPKNAFCGPKSDRDCDMVICRSGVSSRIKPVYGYSESRMSIFDKMFCFHLGALLERSEVALGMDLVKISEIFRIYPWKSTTLTINRLVYILVHIIRKNSTEVSSCRNTRLSTRFWPQKRVTSHKTTQNCQKRTKVVGIGQKTEPCGEPSNVDKSRVFLKKP